MKVVEAKSFHSRMSGNERFWGLWVQKKKKKSVTPNRKKMNCGQSLKATEATTESN